MKSEPKHRIRERKDWYIWNPQKLNISFFSILCRQWQYDKHTVSYYVFCLFIIFFPSLFLRQSQVTSEIHKMRKREERCITTKLMRFFGGYLISSFHHSFQAYSLHVRRLLIFVVCIILCRRSLYLSISCVSLLSRKWSSIFS